MICKVQSVMAKEKLVVKSRDRLGAQVIYSVNISVYQWCWLRIKILKSYSYCVFIT